MKIISERRLTPLFKFRNGEWVLTCTPLEIPYEDVLLPDNSHWVYDGCGYWRCAVCMERVRTQGSWDPPGHRFCSGCGSHMIQDNRSCYNCVHRGPDGVGICVTCRFHSKWEKEPFAPTDSKEV